MPKVFSFEAFNHAEGLVVRPAFKMSAEDIRLWGFTIIEDTGEEVPDNWLDLNGRYDPEGRELALPKSAMVSNGPTSLIGMFRFK
jgi:hypothetical protein